MTTVGRELVSEVDVGHLGPGQLRASIPPPSPLFPLPWGPWRSCALYDTVMGQSCAVSEEASLLCEEAFVIVANPS